VQMGAKVDLNEWVFKALKKRGFAEKNLVADTELTPSVQRKVVAVLRRRNGLRRRRMHEHARTQISGRASADPPRLQLFSTRCTPTRETCCCSMAPISPTTTSAPPPPSTAWTSSWPTSSAMARRTPPWASRSEVGCRVGRSTAYPHPNQFLHNKITRGQALQIEGGVHIAGCGGELYRADVHSSAY